MVWRNEAGVLSLYSFIEQGGGGLQVNDGGGATGRLRHGRGPGSAHCVMAIVRGLVE